MTPIVASAACSVAFSHDIFVAQHAGGISRCFIELMRALGPLQQKWALWSGHHDNDLLRAATAEPWMREHTIPAPVTVGTRVRDEADFSAWLDASDAAVVHRTYYTLRDRAKKIPHVETLHDMWSETAGLLREPKTVMRSMIKKRSLQRADLIVCVSDHSRRELEATWPWASGRTTVIPHGVRPLAAVAEPALRERPFFLFVGRRGGYKNFALAVTALAQARLPDHELLCFGGGLFTPGEKRAIADAGLAGRVHQVGGSDARLAGLYAAAVGLLYPSSYEGFGLPVLEAMIHQCPVIAADLTSIPEVAGDAAWLLPVLTPEAWRDALERLAMLTDGRASMIARGEARARDFSWHASARAHSAAYQALC